MNIAEALVKLIPRVGWRDDKTAEGFVLDATNLVSDSGRYFQDEHSSVTLLNIKDCQPLENIDDDDYNSHLTNMVRQVCIQVLSDVFEKDFVDDQLLILYPTAFDNIISMRMTIVAAELIMTSTRNNRTSRLTEQFVGKLNYDIFRDAPNKFAIRDLNFKHTMGISTRYEVEIMSVKRRFGGQRNLIKSITKGRALGDNYYTNNE